MFEEAYATSKEITVFEKIGKPEFKKADTLTNREISAELKKAKELLNKYQVDLSTIYPVDDRTLYSFIVDEFMQKPIQDFLIPGFMSCFIYEEFHPNHEGDIKWLVRNTVEALMNKNENGHELSRIENFQELNAFFNAFEIFTLHHFNIHTLQIEGDDAECVFSIKFSGRIDVVSTKVVFSGNGKAKLKYHDPSWNISRLELPV